jgi:hypothetical protein
MLILLNLKYHNQLIYKTKLFNTELLVWQNRTNRWVIDLAKLSKGLSGLGIDWILNATISP